MDIRFLAFRRDPYPAKSLSSPKILNSRFLQYDFFYLTTGTVLLQNNWFHILVFHQRHVLKLLITCTFPFTIPLRTLFQNIDQSLLLE